MSKEEMSLEELDCWKKTIEHILLVREYGDLLVSKLQDRLKKHDDTKLEDPAFKIFVEYTPKLAECEYNSEEYKNNLEEMKVALEYHYARSRHHPEHFKNGINDMSILDILEMFIDWNAATKRHLNGNLKKSIESNSKRFNIDHQLTQILMNSIELFDD